MKKTSKYVFHLNEHKTIGCTVEFFVDKRPENIKKYYKQCAESDQKTNELDALFCRNRISAAKKHLHHVTGLYLCSDKHSTSTGHVQ